jgi:hypothetical protein
MRHNLESSEVQFPELQFPELQSLYKFLSVKLSPSLGCTCTLQVDLPAALDHDFWDHTYLNGRNNFSWESKTGACITLKVNGYGYDAESARWNAACYVKHIIQDIRCRLKSSDPPLPDEGILSAILSFDANPDPNIFEQVKVLEQVWKVGSLRSKPHDPRFYNAGISLISQSKLPSTLVHFYVVRLP